MIRFKSFEAERHPSKIVAEHCDPAIAHAVVVCLDSFKSTDSIASTVVVSCSIPAKIAKHLDPVLTDFARRKEVPLTKWSGLSELVLDPESMDLNIHLWGRKIIDRAHLQGHEQSIRAAHTIDTLRNFARFCRSFRSIRTPFQIAEKSKDGKFLYHYSEQRPRPRKDPFPKPIEFFFDKEGWCELCCSHTQTELFRLEKIAEGDYIDSKLPLYVNSLSPRYCADHAPTEGHRYKRDLIRREYWHATMRALIEARLAMGLDALDFEELRASTYGLVFPQRSVLPSVKAICDYVKNLTIRLDKTESRVHLLELLRLAMAEVKKASP